MDDIKVSIVVPVYMAENYLEECIESILNQTYENLQIIFVDDGSPDRCGEIIEHYMDTDNRIHVIHTKNGGVSSARNIGVESANGDYIAFIDSDDFIDSNYVEKLLEIALKYDVDIVGCGFSAFRDGSLINSETDHETIMKLMTSEQAVFEMYKNDSIGWNAWCKLYKRDLFEDICYPTGIGCSEDKATTYKLFLKAKKIAYTTEPLYYYRLRKNSISSRHSTKHCLDSIMVNNLMEEDFEKRGMRDAALLAKSYSAKCAFVLYIDAANREDFDEVKRKCLYELSHKYKYIRYARYLKTDERIGVMLAGISACTKSKVMLTYLCSLADIVRKRRTVADHSSIE